MTYEDYIESMEDPEENQDWGCKSGFGPCPKCEGECSAKLIDKGFWKCGLCNWQGVYCVDCLKVFGGGDKFLQINTGYLCYGCVEELNDHRAKNNLSPVPVTVYSLAVQEVTP